MLKTTPQKKSVFFQTKNLGKQTKIRLTSELKTAIHSKSYHRLWSVVVSVAMIFSGIMLPYSLGGILQPALAGASDVVYINGYPTQNGNYLDCNGNIDNDMGHHVTDPADTDPAHHIGQNCPNSLAPASAVAVQSQASKPQVTFINGYPTQNGNYLDCNGNIDNDMGHHVTDPADTDPAHHIGQNCPTVAVTTSVAPAPVAAVSIANPIATPSTIIDASSHEIGSVFSGAKLFVNPYSDAANWVNANRAGNPSGAALMGKIAAGAETQWFGDWNSDVRQDVSGFVDAAASAGALPTLVAYNIPDRDCSGYSSGGAQTPDAYTQWISEFAAGLGGHKAAVILEPDATSLTDCLSSSGLQTRYGLLSNAVSTLKGAGAAVYIDAGHPDWISPSDMAGRLEQAGIAQADGFALNISNFFTTADNISYGQQVSALVGGKHFVIDTSRNGNGPTPDQQWCNPNGRALGELPTTNTGNPLVDAFLWVKTPGESDGQCNGGPSAGVFWPQYAIGLAQNASW